MNHNILIVDSHSFFRESLGQALQAHEPRTRIVGSVGSVMDAVAVTMQDAQPGMVVSELFLPDGTGFKLAETLRGIKSDIRILFITEKYSIAYFHKAHDVGACGLISKYGAIADVMRAIATVRDGGSVLGPTRRRGSLSPRESQVLALIGHGYSNRSIGEKLGIAAKSVDSYRNYIRAKLALPPGDIGAYAVAWAKASR